VPLQEGILMILLAIASVTDLKSYKIPNLLTLTGIGIGVMISAAIGWEIFIESMMSALIGFIMFYLLYLCKGVGGGDVKLFTMIGIYLSVPQLLEVTMMTLIFALIIGGVILLVRGVLFFKAINGYFALLEVIIFRNRSIKEMLSSLKKTEIPLMLAVFPACLMVLWWPFVTNSV
jgi:prepilin peptidase CpaA